MYGRTIFHSAVVLAVGLAIVPNMTPVAAQAFWLNTSNTNATWNNPANWSTGSVPSSDADSATFQEFATYEVWWDNTTGDTSAGPLTIAAGDVTFLDVAGGPHTHSTNGLLVDNGAALTLSGVSLDNVSFDFLVEANTSLTLESEANVSVPGPQSLEVRGQFSINAGCSFVGDLQPIDGGASVTVQGAGATLSTDGIGGFFEIGTTDNGTGPATLSITNGGAVMIPETSFTNLGPDSAVNIDNGSFAFGCCTVDSFRNVNVTSGTLSGLLTNTGVTDVAELSYLHDNPDVSASVILTNSGTMYGDARFDFLSITNSATGELETVAGERMLFPGIPMINFGEINNFGGEFRFGLQTHNDSAGFISGRGIFASEMGWLNDGVMAFSGGFADVLGDVENSATGTIAIAGNSITTFYDDVLMDAGNPNINAISGSTTVFFGSYNGGNSGTGTVEAFGDLRPGNSPAVVSFGGDLFLGHTSTTEIELAGPAVGQFDRLDVAGDLTLGGNLAVTLIDGFTLECNQAFIVADVAGIALGTFSNYGEGDVVGNFGGTDLLISYVGGDGNDVVLQTPTVLLGDINQDGVVNLLDVDPFIARLSSGIYQAEADINKDGVVNLLDVDPFIAVLGGG